MCGKVSRSEHLVKQPRSEPQYSMRGPGLSGHSPMKGGCNWRLVRKPI
jgi:hypothetical protein